MPFTRVAACVLVLAIVVSGFAAFGVTADPKGGGPTPSPPGDGGGLGSEGAGPSGGEGDGGGEGTGPDPPPASEPENITYEPPYANLTISFLRPDRETGGVGDSVEFVVLVENAGYRLVERANLTLYDGVVSNATAVAWTEVDLWDFEGVGVLHWTPALPGDHTVIAFIDANYTVPETNESDNTLSALVHVIGGATPGVPDVMVGEGDVGVSGPPEAGNATTLQVRVRNTGDAPALTVSVRVQDDGTTLDWYTVPSIPVGGQHIRLISWTPGQEGPHAINITADVNDTMRELREDNNAWGSGISVLRNGYYQGCTRIVGNYVVPPGIEEVYDSCTLFAFNVTVLGTLRFVNGSSLILGIWTFPPLVPGGTYAVTVYPGGLLEFADSTIEAAMRDVGFRFLSDGAFYLNRSAAFFAWGARPQYQCPDRMGRAPSDCVGRIPGGLVVRTSLFHVEDSTVAYGTLHGLYLDGVDYADCGGTPCPHALDGNTFRDNWAMGLVLRNHTDAAVGTSVFRGNRVGLYLRGESLQGGQQILTARAWVTGSAFRDGLQGLQSREHSWVNATGNTFEHHTLAILLVSEPGYVKNDTVASNAFDLRIWQLGVYAYRASPSVERNALWNVEPWPYPTVRAGLVLDRSLPFEDPSGRWPRAIENNISHAWGLLGYIQYGIIAWETDVRIDGNLFVYVRDVISCLTTACTVNGNTMGLPGGTAWGGGIFRAVSATQGSDLVLTNSTSWHGGGTTWFVFVNRSTAFVQDNGWAGAGTSNGSAAYFQESPAPRLLHSRIRSTVQILLSPTAEVLDNDLFGKVSADWSPDLTFRNNNVTSADGLQLVESPGAVVEWNAFGSPFRYNETNPIPSRNAVDRAHVKVYNNSTAEIGYNTMRNGSWGVSLDDRLGLTPRYRATFARIHDNWIEGSGYIAVGVDTSARAYIVGNAIENSTGWAVQMESGFRDRVWPGPDPQGNRELANLVAGNRINDTGGLARYFDGGAEKAAGCNFSTVVLSSESGVRGDAEVREYRIARTSGTGIRYCIDLNNLYVHDNALDNTGRGVEAGITLEAANRPARVERNTVTGFAIGVWVKHRGGYNVGYNRIAGNPEGVRVGEGTAANATAEAALHDNVIENGTVGVNVTAKVYFWGPPLGWALYSGHARLERNWIGNFTDAGVSVSLWANRTIPDVPPYVELLDRNQIANATYGIRVRSYVNDTAVDPAVRPYAVVRDHNTVEDATYGVYLQGNQVGGTTYTVYADLSDNNTVASNSQYGIYVDAATVDLVKLRVWWNDVRENTAAGLYVTGDPPGPDYFHAECNWWDDASGPYDPPPDNPDSNPGTGQPVSDYFWYRDPPPPPARELGWLNNPSSAPGTSCTGGL